MCHKFYNKSTKSINVEIYHEIGKEKASTMLKKLQEIRKKRQGLFRYRHISSCPGHCHELWLQNRILFT